MDAGSGIYGLRFLHNILFNLSYQFKFSAILHQKDNIVPRKCMNLATEPRYYTKFAWSCVLVQCVGTFFLCTFIILYINTCIEGKVYMLKFVGVTSTGCFLLTASLSVTSFSVVCSFPYHHCTCSSLPTAWCCFTSWCAASSSYVSHTGRLLKY